MENLPNHSTPSILERPHVREFIEENEIKSEDYPLVEELATFDNNLIIECLHNTFNTFQERSEKELEIATHTARTSEQRLLYQKALEFLRRYNWAIALRLTRTLEKKR
jgi:hypothetical protein